MTKLRARPGFTLLELLVSIAIFSGVMILALGAFARSSTSAAKSRVTQAKAEAARSLVDQISNDFRYVDLKTKPTNCPSTAFAFCVKPPGLNLGQDSVRMAIKYPDQTYVMKTYFVSQNVLRVQEYRDCAPNTSQVLVCPNAPSVSTVLDGKYQLGNEVMDTIFTDNPASTVGNGNYLGVNIVVKPKEDPDCDTAGSSCYELKTTLVPGGY